MKHLLRLIFFFPLYALADNSVTLNANQITYNHETMESLYQGDVHMDLGHISLSGEQMTVTHQNDAQPSQMQMIGSPVELEDKADPKKHIHSNKVSVYPEKALVILEDDVEITSGFEHLACSKLRYHMNITKE